MFAGNPPQDTLIHMHMAEANAPVPQLQVLRFDAYCLDKVSACTHLYTHYPSLIHNMRYRFCTSMPTVKRRFQHAHTHKHTHSLSHTQYVLQVLRFYAYSLDKVEFNPLEDVRVRRFEFR